ncbi:glycosyl transferase family protein [Vibrio genomosp. F10]|uniref:Glycosyl transferase n=2 Tax=Vibrio genomosp. F10 TaxID=723171 RepID=A0A1B9R311_9VIBR|nr:glycosyl transferase family protein [Vibrio genomosp. F10]OCH78717.1 glycosyl transferase [Vibrio genomosp. F10]OEE37521.1 glycosyl transferase [Vibrio genomosp. F10 str. ZF-129]OEE94495.1 glycosyl transferase [Vibrio genomosp. F10 str. 9ZC157]OEE97265.1 glycosyl transferase [Vibrio genomosp. F10 str. 9ZD137]
MSTIQECIRTVGRGERGRKPLTLDQAYRVMDEYLDGQIGDDQMAMLLMLIRVQNETKQEIAGFVKAFQSRVPNVGADIDWPCYAGKRKTAGKPWHILAARILADNGYKVLVHGYTDHATDREHAQDYLVELGITVAQDAAHAKALIESESICYLPLEHYAPQAKIMLDWRKRYGLRTPINTVVRALNPGGGKIGIRGSFHPGFQQLHAEIEHEVDEPNHSVISFKGQSGESEYNPKVSQNVWLSTPKGVESYYWEADLISTLPLPERCIFDTPEEDQEMMANTIITTLAAILFAQTPDRPKALAEASQYWQRYCERAK